MFVISELGGKRGLIERVRNEVGFFRMGGGEECMGDFGMIIAVKG